MILHDRCIVTFTERRDRLDPTPPRTAPLGEITCEVTPLESDPASDSSPLVTRYTFFTTTDLVEAHGAQVAAWAASSPGSQGATMAIAYRGQELTLEAGLEVHRVLGRFHHIEAIVQDFGPIST